MSESEVFVVYTSGPDGQSFPYGVFSARTEAEKARKAIISELDELHDEASATDLARLFAGSLEERVSIRECEIRDEFHGESLDDFLEGTDE